MIKPLVISTNEKLEEAVSSIVKELDYDIWKEIFLHDNDRDKINDLIDALYQHGDF